MNSYDLRFTHYDLRLLDLHYAASPDSLYGAACSVRPTSNNSERGGRQPLDGGLEKRAFESRLEGAGIGFADSKLRSDFELRGAMDFHVEFAVLDQ